MMDSLSDINLLNKIAQKGFVVFSVNYTLVNYGRFYSSSALGSRPPPNCSSNLDPQKNCTALNHNYPAPDEINGAVTYIKEFIRINNYNIDLDQLSIGGLSSGAHLALIEATRNNGSTDYNCVIDGFGTTDLVSGVLQITAKLPTRVGDFPFPSIDIVRGAWGSDPLDYASPALFASTFNGRKLFVAHAQNDNLIPIEQATTLIDNIQLYKPNVDVFFNTWDDSTQYDSEYIASHTASPGNIEEIIPAFLNNQCKSLTSAISSQPFPIAPTNTIMPAASLIISCPTTMLTGSHEVCTAKMDRIQSGDWYVNNVTQTICKNKNSCSLSNVPSGKYNVQAIGKDLSGVKVYSNAITVEVKASPTPVPTTTPSLSISCPTSVTAGSSATCTATINGIQSGHWYVNNIVQSSCANKSSCTWTNISAGDYTIHAKGTDSSGKSILSNSIKISVKSK